MGINFMGINLIETVGKPTDLARLELTTCLSRSVGFSMALATLSRTRRVAAFSTEFNSASHFY